MSKTILKDTGETGFTLIEVMVGIALLTIVIGSIYSTFFTVDRAMERFDGLSVRYHEARTTLDIIRREIESSFLKEPGLDKVSGDSTVFIIKDRDILGKDASILSLTAFSLRSKGVNKVTYYIEEREDKRVLVKSVHSPAGLSKEFKVDMVDKVEGFSIETMFNNRWVKTWDASETGRLPEVVKLTIEFDDKGKKVKLSEYATPKIGAHL